VDIIHPNQEIEITISFKTNSYYQTLKPIRPMKTILILPITCLLYLNISAQETIIGGQDAMEGQFPWIASLYVLDDNFCGGALIASEWVITAAHCIIDEDLSIFKVRLNSVDADGPLNLNGGIELDIAEVHIHPEYNYEDAIGQYVDLALIRLSEPVTTIAPIALAQDDEEASIYESWSTVYVAGWGIMLENGNPTYPNIMQWVSSTIYDFEMCQINTDSDITDEFFCVGFTEGQPESGAAHGDSGGPAWIEEEGNLKLTGVVHGALYDYTEVDQPGVFVKIAGQNEWINSIIGTALHTGSGLNQNVRIENRHDEILLHTHNIHGDLLIQIFGIHGTHLRDYVLSRPGNTVHKVQIAELPAGFYIIRVGNGNDGYAIKKFAIN